MASIDTPTAATATTGAAPPIAVPLDASRQRRIPSSVASATLVDDGLTRPMFIPAILQQPKNKHLAGALGKKAHGEGDDEGRRKASKSGAAGGKRRQRRYENAQLAGNPHLHRPTRADFSPGPYLKGISTTFAPPPATFSRSTYISSSPAATPSPASLASSTDSGQFTMSLRGLRRTLRTAVGQRTRRGEGGRTEEVLEIMERELVSWLTLSGRIPEGFYHESPALVGSSGGKVLDPTPVDDFVFAAAPSLPDLPASHLPSPSAPVAPCTLTELSRQPHAIVWLAPSPHHRFLLHALARYYSLQSFSRPLSPLEPDMRVTHVLRPQLVRPRAAGLGALGAGHLETPPGTDWSTAGGTTTEGEMTAPDSEAYETDTDAASVLSGGAEPEEWDRVSAVSVPSAAGQGGTDDEAEAVYSTESDSVQGETDDSEYERDGEDGGVDSLASSFADLAASAPASGTATPSRPSPAPFLPFVPTPSNLGSATPIPSFRLSPSGTPVPSASAASDATPTRPSRPSERVRGRRSLPGSGLAAGYDTAESSPSRSPTRGLDSGRRGFAGVAASDWRLPEKGFVDWLLE